MSRTTSDQDLLRRIDLLHDSLADLSTIEIVYTVGNSLMQLGLSRIVPQQQEPIPVKSIPHYVDLHENNHGETLESAIVKQGYLMVTWLNATQHSNTKSLEKE